MYPRKDVTIQGVPARLFAEGYTVDKPLPKAIIAGEEITTVSSAEDIAKAMGDEDNIHVCPLCEDGFVGYLALRLHAPDCVQKYAPRRHIWTPPGFAGNVAQTYDAPVRITD